MTDERENSIHPFFSLLLGKSIRNLTPADLPNIEILERFIGPIRSRAGARNALRWSIYICALALVAGLVGSGHYLTGIVGLSLLYWSVKVALGMKRQDRE